MKVLSSLALAGALLTAAAPAATAQRSASPYHTRLAVDAPITLGLAGGSVLGLYLIRQKDGLDDAQLAALRKTDVPSFDRFSAGWYSDAAQTKSDYLCYGSIAAVPIVLAFNPNVRAHYGQVAGLFVQTMLATDAIFTNITASFPRYRPYLYGSEGGGGRNGRIATSSFFAGHTAHTATATFFMAKVFSDFNPDSPARPYVWGVAAVLPAAVAYYRIEAGKHFLSDNLVGYTLGAGMGILVPQLHKITGRAGVSLVPLQGLNPNGYAYSGLLLSKQL